jgi:hypothetical protein
MSEWMRFYICFTRAPICHEILCIPVATHGHLISFLISKKRKKKLITVPVRCKSMAELLEHPWIIHAGKQPLCCDTASFFCEQTMWQVRNGRGSSIWIYSVHLCHQHVPDLCQIAGCCFIWCGWAVHTKCMYISSVYRWSMYDPFKSISSPTIYLARYDLSFRRDRNHGRIVNIW